MVSTPFAMPPDLPVAPDPAPILPSIDPADMKLRDERFTASPDPWAEIVLLEYGADRSFATTISRMVIEAEPAQRPAFEQRLLETLRRAELTEAGRQFVCRMLAMVGTAASVPALASLLSEGRTADDARLALDAIDAPEVDIAYRAALPKLRGRARLGLIGSIVVRGDVAAVDALTAIAIDAAEPAEARDAAEAAVKQLTAKP